MPDGSAADADLSFAALNGLYRLVVRLADEGALLLAVDDPQWSDPASLRFVAYLARRLTGLRVLLAATVRVGEPATDDALLAEIVQDPAAVSIAPRALSPDGVRARRVSPARARLVPCSPISGVRPRSATCRDASRQAIRFASLK